MERLPAYVPASCGSATHQRGACCVETVAQKKAHYGGLRARVQDMGAEQSAPAEEWPPGWSAMTSEKQKTARGLILGISAEPRTDFLAIADASYCIPAAEWRFEQYHAAATAAVQEDQKLNRCVYCLVPRHLSESDFWRLYFSKTLAILDSVKTHGTFPPPAPKAVAKKKKAKAAAAPPPEDDSYCAVQ